MQFLSPDQAQREPYRTEYRYGARWTSVLLLAAVAVAIASGAGAWRMLGRDWIGVILLGWVAVWFVVLSAVLQSNLRARLKPGGWLVRTQADGILVGLRSYMNDHFSPDDPVVVRLAYSDIEWAREHRVDRTIPGSVRGDDTRYRHRYLELGVHAGLAEEIERHVADERRRRGPARPRWKGNGYSFHSHYPVQTVEGRLVRVEWAVRPGLRQFFDEVGARVRLRSSERTEIDFRELGRLTTAEQEGRILELLDSGNRVSAIHVARELYTLDLTQAVRFIDELSGTGRPPS